MCFSGTDNDTHWKISSHENFFRMRMKMVPNDMFDDHLDASRARDNQDYEPSGKSKGVLSKTLDLSFKLKKCG